jgi:Flp pilus assembly pilin Flp
MHVTPLITSLIFKSLSCLRREEGQTLAEYGILVAFIAVVVILTAITLGGKIASLFASTGSHV